MHKKDCNTVEYDIVVLGGGSAGIAAAAAAAKQGKSVLLVDAGSMLGGELISGMPVDGAVNARGEWIQGGIICELFEQCERWGGYIGPINDHRLIYYVAFDPEIMKMAVAALLDRYKVECLLHTFACEVETEGASVRSLTLLNKSGKTVVRAPVFLDCSGDGDLAFLAGADALKGDGGGCFQPISLMFRMSGVETRPLLDFVRTDTDSFALGESDAIRNERSDAELAQSLWEQGEPAVFLRGDGPLMAAAIKKQELFPTALIMIQPTSSPRREVCLNTTRVANVDATNTAALSKTMVSLMDQILQCSRFMKKSVPGFENAVLAGIAPRLGIRETRRIIGEYSLSGEEVLTARKSDTGVAKGCHHVDIHQDGTGQVRIPVADGGSYDIPWGCLIPKKLDNVLMAGRCVSADREAHGSMRVMGSCMGMGQSIGIAASMFVTDQTALKSVHDIPVESLRTSLRKAGAILDGTY